VRRTVDRAARSAARHLESTFGGPTRTRVILVLAAVLSLSSADTATVGASATQLRSALHISNTDIGLLVAVNSLVAAVASVPFGVLADRVKRTRALGLSILLWGGAMFWSATTTTFGELLLARLALGVVVAIAGPVVASLVGDYFPSSERGRIFGWILTGELLGAGVGFVVTGDIAALSWRAAFVILALPTFVLARFVFRLPEPLRGNRAPLVREGDTDESGPGGAPWPELAADPRRIDAQVAGAGPPESDSKSSETDAQRMARSHGLDPDPVLVDASRRARRSFFVAMGYILRIRTNVILIASSACGYFYLAGMETFAVEFAKEQFRVNQAVANLLLLVIGAGAVAGVLVTGGLSDRLLHRRVLNARILVTAILALLATVLFIPALLTRSPVTALPYLVVAAFALSGQNPPIDAARLDIMPSFLWGRAEGLRTGLRTGAQSLAPVIFGATSDYVFGGGRSGLKWTFILMLAPLGASGVILLRALRTYPPDVATAAAASALAMAEASAAPGDGSSRTATAGGERAEPGERRPAGAQPRFAGPSPPPTAGSGMSRLPEPWGQPEQWPPSGGWGQPAGGDPARPPGEADRRGRPGDDVG
jgi:MFS family permease